MPLILDALAQRYGVPPSTLMDKSVDDLQIDYFCVIAGVKSEQKEMKKTRLKNGR